MNPMIHFTAAPPEPWLTLSFLAALLLAALVHHRLRLAPPVRLALAALRALILVIALAALFQPVREATEPEQSAERLIILRDVSASMALPDSSGKTRSVAALATAATWADEWRARGGVQKRELLQFTFAENCRLVDRIAGASETGALTDLAGALTTVQAAMGGRPPAGVVLITDGRANVDGDLFSAADRLQCPIFPVWPASGEAGARWLWAEAPAVVASGRPITFRGEALGKGTIGLTLAEVTAAGAERRIARQEVTAGPIAITAPARGPGDYTFRLRLDGPGATNDSTRVDNVRTFTVNVPAARDILLFAGRLSWEYKYLRQALNRPGLPTVHVVAFDENRAVYTANRGRDFARPRQWRPDQLGRLAALIVVDATPEAMPAAAVEAVRAAVSDGLVGLAVAGDLEASPLLPLIQARSTPDHSESSEMLRGLRPGHPLDPAIAALRIDGPRFTLEPTAAGQGLAGFAGGGAVMTEGRLGLGRVIAIGFPVWRSAFAGEGTRAVERFWGDLARYLAPPPRRQLSVKPPRNAVAPGEEVMLEIEADTGLDAFTARADGAGLSGPLPIEGRRLRVKPLAEGECRITVSTSDNPRLSTTVYLPCVRFAREHAELEADTVLLAALATRSGGEARPASASTPVGLTLAGQPPSYLRRRLEPVWDYAAVFFILAGLLTLEWMIRRRHGLI